MGFMRFFQSIFKQLTKGDVLSPIREVEIENISISFSFTSSPSPSDGVSAPMYMVTDNDRDK